MAVAIEKSVLLRPGFSGMTAPGSRALPGRILGDRPPILGPGGLPSNSSQFLAHAQGASNCSSTRHEPELGVPTWQKHDGAVTWALGTSSRRTAGGEAFSSIS